MRSSVTDAEAGSTFVERQRAYGHFKAVLDVHDAAISAFELLPSLPDNSAIVSVSIAEADA